MGLGNQYQFLESFPKLHQASYNLNHVFFTKFYNTFPSPFREAWLRLSMQYHPDLNPDDEKASQRFMEIKESYKGFTGIKM